MEYGRSQSLILFESSYLQSKWISLSILIFVNLMNYTDRYSLAGILINLKEEFQIDNDLAGLIQTVFIIVYMFAAPIFGFLGDRYNRKLLLSFGLVLWNLANIAASFTKQFWAFMIFRAVFAIGQSCYTTVAPSLISDLVVGDMRSRILAIFYTAIPVGNGLGYIVGTQMTRAFGDWRWSLRATPFLSVISVFLLLVVLKEPQRGEIEEAVTLKKTTWTEDLKYLLKNPCYVFSSLGFTAVAFTTGAVFWFAPHLNYLGFKSMDVGVDYHAHGSIFGLISLFSGFFGLFFGYVLTFKLKKRFPPIDPLVCGIGLLLSGPLLIGATYMTQISKILTYALQFYGFILMNVNWAITVDIAMYVVVPWTRGSSMGLQLLIGHSLGDAGSPYLTGLVSVLLYGYFDSPEKEPFNVEFEALQSAYFISCAVEILGSAFFFLSAWYLVSAMEKVKRDIEAAREESQSEAPT